MANIYTGKNVMEAINNINTSDDNSKEIRITPPEGYEIDKENSTFDCIKFKPVGKRWRDSMLEAEGYYINDDSFITHTKTICGANNPCNHNVFATIKQAKSALAMARISQIMANDERFGGVVTDKEWNSSKSAYTIERIKDTYEVQSKLSYYSFLAFHTREQCDLFIKENDDLIKDYLMID